MFKEARIKLTGWYLVIIMAISIFFSVIIYRGAVMELDRIQRAQMLRRPPPASFVIDLEVLEESKRRIIFSLILVNAAILGISALAGYFLAGKTLDPIAKMVDEQKKFVGNASHELRTPLTSLKTEIEVALRDPKTKNKNILKSNLEEINRMQKLTNYLLELNRYEEGRGIPMTKVDLRKIVLNMIGKKKVKTDLRKSIIVGNEDALIELVTILLDNAFKYSPKRSEVSIKVKDGTIEVIDKGIGISKENLPHIFDRFYRSDKSRGTDGYGLGLSIAKSIVDLHKGRIEVESKLGKGSIFRVHLS